MVRETKPACLLNTKYYFIIPSTFSKYLSLGRNSGTHILYLNHYLLFQNSYRVRFAFVLPNMSPNCSFLVCFLRAGIQNKYAEGLPSLAKITSRRNKYRQLINLVSPISLLFPLSFLGFLKVNPPLPSLLPGEVIHAHSFY